MCLGKEKSESMEGKGQGTDEEGKKMKGGR